MAGDENPGAQPATTPGDETAGAMLARAREAAGLSIEAVGTQLKLAPRQVRALESGDFASLPGRTFVRGFVRNYARLVNLDVNRVVAALPGDDDPALSHPHLASTHRVMGEIPAEHAHRRSFAGWAIVLALLAIIVVAIAYEILRPAWPLRMPFDDKPAATAPARDEPAAPAPSAIPSTPTPAPSTAAPPAMGNPGAARELPNPVAPGNGNAAPTSGAADSRGGNNMRLAADAVGATPSVTSGSAPMLMQASTASLSSSPDPTAPAASQREAAQAKSAMVDATKAAEPGTASASSPTLQIVFRGTSWIDVKDASGTSLLTLTGNEGATRTLDAPPPLDLVVGNADHVDILFRGNRVDLVAHARQNVARLQLR